MHFKPFIECVQRPIRHYYVNDMIPLTDRKVVIAILFNLMINLDICELRAILKTLVITRVCNSPERPERSLLLQV